MFFSLIIPVFNRPEEIDTVLACLVNQTYSNFEVIIVESGSVNTAESVVNSFKDRLDVSWYMYKNDGQGFSRNYGMTKAKGDYFVILDSDILLDPNYLENLYSSLKKHYIDAFGGPDRYHKSFKPIQKAIDHVMTSILTTGGIRGNKNHVGKFYPRSFNMGFSRAVYEKTQGFRWPFFGEDIELSRRIMENGFTTGLVPEAYVYHKRKLSLAGHWKQMHFFGRARINIYKTFPDTLKLTHFFPAAFTVFLFSIPVVFVLLPQFGATMFAALVAYLFFILISGTVKYKSLWVGLLSVPAVFTQMVGYGFGFIKDFTKRVIFRQEYDTKNKD